VLKPQTTRYGNKKGRAIADPASISKECNKYFTIIVKIITILWHISLFVINGKESGMSV